MLYQKRYRRYLYYHHVLLAYLLVFVAGFYFTSLPSSRHSAFVRGGLLLIMLVSAIEFLVHWRRNANEVFRDLGAWIRCTARPAKFLGAGLAVLLFYYMLQSCFYGDWSSARRVFTVGMFLLCVAMAVLKLDFRVGSILYPVAMLGMFFALSYGISIFDRQIHDVGGPFRDATSGLSWFASYTNTIVAGLFWSPLALALIWAYAQSRKKVPRLLYFVSGCVVLFAIYHTAARTAWIATMLGVASLFYYMDRKARTSLLFLIIPSTLVIIPYTLLYPEAIVRKGLTYRDHIWVEHVARLESWKDWVFGKGMGAIEPFVKLPGGSLAIHPHSIYIETLYTGGLVAVFLLFFVLITALYCLLDRKLCFKGKEFVGPLLVGAIVAMAVDFNDLFGTPNLVWLWFWFPMAVLLAGTLKPKAHCSPELLDRSSVETEKRSRMKKLSQYEYLSLREGGKVIEQDGYGDKVIILPDGTYLKLFRRKRLVSSALIWPYAQRFADNAAELRRLGVPCPQVIDVFRVPSIERDIVHYHPLPGVTLRHFRKEKPSYPEDLREQFFAFVDRLHDLGIYFRSVHLGNVVLTPDGELGLIDISDMRIYNRPLSRALRRRNSLHMQKDKEDWHWLQAKG